MNKKLLILIGLLIILIFAIIGLIYRDSKQSNFAPLFSEELQRAGVERVGQPIEGFNAFIYLEAFPGFEEEDFDNVETLEGITKSKDGELIYERTASSPVTSAESTISEKGYATLLTNFSKRVGIEVRTETDIATLLEKLREGDEVQASYITDDFSIWYPDGWYPYENDTGVLFVHDENLQIPQNTEGFALGSYFQITVHAISVEEMFAQNLWNEGSEFLISKESVRVKTQEATRVVTKAAGADGEVLHYVFEATDGRVFTLSHYPYERGSSDTDDFERIVQTFMINYVFDGTEGIGDEVPVGRKIEGWNTYSNSALDFEIDYPPSWQYRERRPEESVALIAVFGETIPSEDYPLLIYQYSGKSEPIGQLFKNSEVMVDIVADQNEPMAKQMLESFRFLK
jgi:hypothetical protein